MSRFGPLPEPAIALVASHRLRLAAKPLGVRKVDAGPERTMIQFVPNPPFDPAKLILRMQRDDAAGIASGGARRRHALSS